MTPTEPEDRAVSVLDLARAGSFAEIREMFAEGLRPMVTAAALQAAWEAELAEYGPVTSVGTPTSEPPAGGMIAVKVPVTLVHGELTLTVQMTSGGQLCGLQLAPAGDAKPAEPWQPPSYANQDRFTEHEVILGSGPLAVPGTLSLPNGPGPFPALVLLGGSGPADRDLTIAKSKPLKDLAWGLASRQVAVLRFDKVTYAHPNEVSKNRAFTVTDEYLPDADAALRLLQGHPAVDAERIFLAGHSLGGTMAPRVAVAEPSVAGLVILAGGTEPMHWAAIRQISYLASLDPATAESARPGIEAMTAQANKVDSADLSPATPDAELPFGVPAPYWLDLRGYDPVALAAGLDKPMLILQGGRDYQVTVTGDLSRWRAGLDHRPNVTIGVYPSDNHFFFPGAGPSSPVELATPQHFDYAVVADIGNWLISGPDRFPKPTS